MNTQMGTTDRRQLAAIALVMATGLIHLVEAPEYFGEVKYIGALFVASAVGAAASAYGIWLLGVAVAGGSLVAYLLSRTIGLPDFREASWEEALEPMGLLSIVVEAAFVALALPVLGRFTGSNERSALNY
jgi:hypothetical protein